MEIYPSGSRRPNENVVNDLLSNKLSTDESIERFRSFVNTLKPLQDVLKQLLQQSKQVNTPQIILVDEAMLQFAPLRTPRGPRMEQREEPYQWLLKNFAGLKQSGLTAVGGFVADCKSEHFIRLNAMFAQFLKELKLKHYAPPNALDITSQTRMFMQDLRSLNCSDRIILFVSSMQLRDIRWTHNAKIVETPLYYHLMKKESPYREGVTSMRYLHAGNLFDGVCGNTLDPQFGGQFRVSSALCCFARKNSINHNCDLLVAGKTLDILPKQPSLEEQHYWPEKVPSDYLILGGKYYS